jgi:hypothetical protein
VIAYYAQKGGKYSVWIGEQPGEEFDEVGVPRLGYDGKSLVHSATRDGKMFVVINGRRGPEFEAVWVGVNPISDDGNHVAYAAREHGNEFVIFDGNRGENFDEVSSPEVSPNGGTVAYQARKGRRWRMVIGDRKEEEFDHLLGEIEFSPCGKRIAYTACDEGAGNKSFVVLDSRKGPEFDQVCHMTFSPDGNVLAYGARAGRLGFIVIGESRIGPFDYVGRPVFNSEGTLLGFGARQGALLSWKVFHCQ